MSIIPAMLAFTLPSVAVAQTPSQPKGDVLFRQRCSACHSITPGAASGLGPNLSGVVGRKAARLGGFAYSPALKKWARTWNAAELDGFLAGPTRAVPGTRMVLAVPDAAQRKAIVAYLATLKGKK